LTSFDVATATSLGTGVAKSAINGGNNLTKPTQAQNLIEVIPYIASSGALTAGQSVLAKGIIESNSVNLLPKQFLVPPVCGGLGTFTSTLSGMLDAVECNTKLQLGSTQQFQVSGQCFIANTVAPKMGMSFHYSENLPTQKEHFYDLPTNETNTGTSATQVSGEDITINDATYLEGIYPLVVPAVVTASESYIGYMSVSSNDFGNSMPLKVPIQPISTALGSHVSVYVAKMPHYSNIHMPMKSSCLISHTYTQEEALTATANFQIGYDYVKT